MKKSILLKSGLFLIMSMMLVFTISCSKSGNSTNPVGQAPSVSTSIISNLTYSSATCGGTITNNQGAPILFCGVCWSTSPNPTIINSKTVDSVAGGSFIAVLNGLLANTTYYVRAYATNKNGTGYGAVVTFTTTLVPAPTLSTSVISKITYSSATGGGTITDNYGLPILSGGICWSTSQEPTIANNKTVDSITNGRFTSALNGLITGTTYYVRAYATNKNGTGYGNTVMFTTPLVAIDIDGNLYHAVTIGTQIWVVENLRTTRYNDGTIIPFVADDYSWIQLTTAAYCWPGNDQSTYGALYNWAAVNSGKLAPAGWHVPSGDEWMTLANFLGGVSTGGGKLKQVGTTLWSQPNTGATDDYGFSALPGGYRSIVNGSYVDISTWGCFWSTTVSNGNVGRFILRYNTAAIDYMTAVDAVNGFSVRCIKD
jgi:uncharacterized protein (TIGR02145 family)